MATAVFMVLMVCGYWYTTRDISSRFKLKRTFGWDVYFLVALYGCIFVLQGVLMIALGYMALWGISEIVNAIPSTVYAHQNVHYHRDFINWSFLGIQAPVVIMLGISVMLCLVRTTWSPGLRLNTAGRKQLYKQLTRANGVEGLLYQCMEQGDMVFITLQSRRVYIGMVHTARCETSSSDNVVVIPMVSGYRDKDTLELRVEHNYARYYQEHGVTPVSRPVNALNFRKVILLSQIETLSLFDPSSACAFEKLIPLVTEETESKVGEKDA